MHFSFPSSHELPASGDIPVCIIQSVGIFGERKRKLHPKKNLHGDSRIVIILVNLQILNWVRVKEEAEEETIYILPLYWICTFSQHALIYVFDKSLTSIA